METFILSINIILAVLLVIIIMLQKSEGGALGIGVSQDSFISSRSAGNFLTKATAVIATLFIVTSIFLTVLSRENMPTTSVLEIIDEKEDSSEPQIPKSE
jgi:preprotein translocase subunit SecG